MPDHIDPWKQLGHTLERKEHEQGAEGRTYLTGHALIWSAAGAIVVIIGLVTVVVLAHQVLLLVFAAALFALMVDALVQLLQKVIPLKRHWLLLLLLIMGMGTITLFITAYSGTLISQTQTVFSQMRQWLETHQETLLNPLGSVFSDMASNGANGDGDDGQDDGLTDIALNWLTSTALTVFTVTSVAFLILVLAAFLLVNPGMYRRGIVLLLPRDWQQDGEAVLQHLQRSLQSWLFGKFLSMIFVTVATLIGLLIIGIPNALVLALLAGALTFIPNFGPIISAIPAVLIAWTTADFALALSVALLYSGIQIVEGNFVTPVIQQHVASLAPAVILTSQVAAASMLGPLGVILAVPLAMVIQVLLIDLHVRRQQGQAPLLRHQAPS
ncbi:MAG: AI-2E family transporter [Planctomycetota bacterium]